MGRSRIKPTKWPVHPAKTQISLGIRLVWSAKAESSLCALWVAKDLNFHQADSENSDAQSDLRLRWAHRSFCWFCHAANHIFYGSDDIDHIWLLYTVDWTSMAISNGKTASSLYYNGPLTIVVGRMIIHSFICYVELVSVVA